MTSTSAEAWQHLRTRLGARQREVIESLAAPSRWPVPDHMGITGSELDQLEQSKDAHKRLSELERMGVAKVVTTRTCTISGRRAKAWALDMDGLLNRVEATQPAAPEEQ